MQNYAQTNLQLYRQLISAGRSAADLALIARCYEAALRLFASRCRANGKPFVAHLVGTAAILAAHGAPIAVVGAGLLHAAYEQGRDQQNPGSARRARLRAQAGDAVEAWVERYTQFRWGAAEAADLSTRLTGLDAIERELVRMRLANALEDHLDYGLLYSAKDKYAASQSPATFAAMARQLGYGALADDLDEVARQQTYDPPAELKSQRQASFDASELSGGAPWIAVRGISERTVARAVKRRLRNLLP
jgi:(p)ppGpp synthase/HD superfamily hydrolase